MQGSWTCVSLNSRLKSNNEEEACDSAGYVVRNLRVRVSGFEIRVSSFGFRVSGFGFRVWGSGGLGSGVTVEVYGPRFRGYGFKLSLMVWVFMLRVSCLGFRVLG